MSVMVGKASNCYFTSESSAGKTAACKTSVPLVTGGNLNSLEPLLGIKGDLNNIGQTTVKSKNKQRKQEAI